MRRIVDKLAPEAVVDLLLVLDASQGQNGLRKAMAFASAAGLTGVVLTKLDGSARGGVALAVASEARLPIRFIGAGETIRDLRPFNSFEFLEALLADEAALVSACVVRARATRARRTARRSIGLPQAPVPIAEQVHQPAGPAEGQHQDRERGAQPARDGAGLIETAVQEGESHQHRKDARGEGAGGAQGVLGGTAFRVIGVEAEAAPADRAGHHQAAHEPTAG